MARRARLAGLDAGAVARACGVTLGTVKRWQRLGVPAKHADAIARLRASLAVKKGRTPWPKYALEYPLETAASLAGVSVSTVRRWQREGVPKDHIKAIRHLRTIKLASRAQRKRYLASSDLSRVASAAGVSTRVVERWRRAGDIPRKHRLFLVDVIADAKGFERAAELPPAPIAAPPGDMMRRLGMAPPDDLSVIMAYPEKEISTFHYGKNRFIRILWTWDLGGLDLTDLTQFEMIHELQQLAPSFPSGPKARYQFALTTNATLSASDDLLLRYKHVQFNVQRGRKASDDTWVRVPIYSNQRSIPEAVITSLDDRIEEGKVRNMVADKLELITTFRFHDGKKND